MIEKNEITNQVFYIRICKIIFKSKRQFIIDKNAYFSFITKQNIMTGLGLKLNRIKLKYFVKLQV